VRFVIKLFYRPLELAMPAENVPCQMHFQDEAHRIRAINPTPYFLTLGMLAIDGRTIALDPQLTLIPPYSTSVLPAKGAVSHVTWQTINDYGGLSQICQQTGSSRKDTAS